MFLSIIIPVYNVEKYIKKCIDSIVTQIDKMHDVEIIVVNDGTKDDSMSIVNTFMQSNAIIRIINQKNQGLSQARNNGLKASSAEYVWFVDSDDYLKANAISYFRSISTLNSNVDVFASYMDRYVEENNSYIEKSYKGKTQWIGKEYLFRNMPSGAAQRFIYKRLFLIKNNLSFVPGILHEDGVWGAQMLYCARNIFLLPDSVYIYRIRSSGSIMSNIKIKSAYDLLQGHKVLTVFLKERVEKGDYFNYRQHIWKLIGCAFGYSKQLFCTDDFKIFYRLNVDYIIKEARWLAFHGSRKNSVLLASVSPKLLMFFMKLRFRILNIFNNV